MTADSKEPFPGFRASNRALMFIALLCAAGALVAAYLTWLHYQVHTNPAFHSFCAMSDSFNCETVAESPYSVFAGLPVAVWGFLAYAAMFFVALAGIGKWPSKTAFLGLLTLSAFSVLVSGLLAYVSYCIICSFCVMCTVTYAINTVMFIFLVVFTVKHRLLSVEAARELAPLAAKRPALLLSGVVLLTLLAAVYPKYWHDRAAAADERLSSGVTKDGHPWIGSNTPELAVIEFSDYLCPHCRRAHHYQRRLVASYPDKMRLVHRHFPLDSNCNPLIQTAFHPGACRLAKAAVCAGEQGRFWEMNDLLYGVERLHGGTYESKAENAAVKLGLNLSKFRLCMSSAEAENALKEDIGGGLRLNLRGTPSYLVNGQVHLGVVKPEVLQTHGISGLD